MKALLDDGERPSLIWLDFYLGDTNGLSVLKILKSNYSLNEIIKKIKEILSKK